MAGTLLDTEKLEAERSDPDEERPRRALTDRSLLDRPLWVSECAWQCLQRRYCFDSYSQLLATWVRMRARVADVVLYIETQSHAGEHKWTNEQEWRRAMQRWRAGLARQTHPCGWFFNQPLTMREWGDLWRRGNERALRL